MLLAPLRFNTGKAGTGLIGFVIILDSHSRVATFLDEVRAVPALFALMRAWWFDPALLLSGLSLIFWSSQKARKAKGTPKPKTVEKRLQDAEDSIRRRFETLPGVVTNFMQLWSLQLAAHDLGRDISRLAAVHGPIIIPAKAEWNGWARDLAFHLQTCQGFAINLGRSYFKGPLFEACEPWNQGDWTVNADAVAMQGWINEHVAHLVEIRSDYAARLRLDGDARPIIS